MADACLIKVELAFDAAPCFVSEPVICKGTCNRSALDVDQVQLQPTGFGNGIIFVGLIGRDGQMCTAIRVPPAEGRSSNGLSTQRVQRPQYRVDAFEAYPALIAF